ncbi:MAG: cation:proton antiporter [Christensenellales bacterium]|jgi:Kef-type K+ transport system membrane component KefB
MEYYTLLLPLALILISSKLLSIGSRRLGMPQVIGMLVAGILLSLVKYIPGQEVFTRETLEGLAFLSKIGVILIMFSAGIETDISQFKKTGVASVVITVLGVVFPLALGFIVACAFNGGFTGLTRPQIISNLFYGAILAATSVSITVATLKELGKLNAKIGTSIITAAIIDDIIGVILLSLLISLKDSNNVRDIGISIGLMAIFFVAAFVVGLLILMLLKWMSKQYGHHRRIPIFAFATCFLFAWAAERWFNVADITGAYIAGLMLSGIGDRDYVDQKIETSNYMIFGPVFFANIGIQTSFGSINGQMVAFGFAIVAAGILGKLLGCGLGAKLSRFSNMDSLRVGLGMMVRAEVVLVCTQKGVSAGLISEGIFPFVLILIIFTTLVTPILLKLSYKNEIGGGLRSLKTPQRQKA